MKEDFNLPSTDSEHRNKRFVSLYGFFSFEHPAYWKNETDETGNYVFYDEHAGTGVLRILTIQNEETGDDAAGRFLSKLFHEQQEFEPRDFIHGKNRFVSFVKIHDVGETEFTVYYWATAHEDKILLFTYTVQSAMKTLPIAMKEKEQILALLETLEFLHHTASHGE